MNTFTHTLTALKGTSAERAWRSCVRVPVMILLWLELRQLFAALDALFNAWRDGSLVLPPPPNPPLPIPQPTLAPPRQCAASPRAASPRRTRARAAQPSAPRAAATQIQRPHAYPAHTRPPVPPARAHAGLRILRRRRRTTAQAPSQNCALIITKT